MGLIQSDEYCAESIAETYDKKGAEDRLFLLRIGLEGSCSEGDFFQ